VGKQSGYGKPACFAGRPKLLLNQKRGVPKPSATFFV
jgi:hypothetical protein